MILAPPSPASEALVAFSQEKGIAYVYRPRSSRLVTSSVLPKKAWALGASYSVPTRRLLVLYYSGRGGKVMSARLRADGRLVAEARFSLPQDMSYGDLIADPRGPLVYLARGNGSIVTFALSRRGLRRIAVSAPSGGGDVRLRLSPDGRTMIVLRNDSELDNQFGGITSFHRASPTSPRFVRRSEIDLAVYGVGDLVFAPSGRRAFLNTLAPGFRVLAVAPNGVLRQVTHPYEAGTESLAFDPLSRAMFTQLDSGHEVLRLALDRTGIARPAGRKRLLPKGQWVGDLRISARNRELYGVGPVLSVTPLTRDGFLGKKSRTFPVADRLQSPAFVPIPSQ